MGWNLFRRKEQPPKETRPWPSNLPPVEEFARSLIDRCALKASIAIPEPGRDDGLLSTRLGEVRVGGPGEQWPRYNDSPMLGICQFNLREAPHVPPTLRGLQFLTVFMAADPKYKNVDLGLYPTSEWCLVRGYASVEELVALKSEAPFQPFRPCGVRWEPFNDPMPNVHNMLDHIGMADAGIPVDESGVNDRIHELLSQLDPHEWRYGTKLGGYPAPVQDDNTEELAFQLGSDMKPEKGCGFMWGDAGCVYVWRNTENPPEWSVDWTCY
jgi:hypothetical protein